MPSFEALVFLFVFLLVAGVGLTLLVVLRSRAHGSLSTLVEAGDFRRALDGFRSLDAPPRDDLLAAARAARNLLDLETARQATDSLLSADDQDGEAWLERALTSACARDFEESREAFSRVQASRSDLLESATLHRAWMELFSGNGDLARRLFDEVEAPLVTKLEEEIGGDPAFAEWYLHAGWLWRARGDEEERAARALAAARAAAPQSVLSDLLEEWWTTASR